MILQEMLHLPMEARDRIIPWSKQQSAPMRHTKPTLPKTPKSTPRAAKDEVHPTFRRSHAFHQVHQDDRSTIYRREHRDQEQKGRHTPRSTSPKRSQLWHPKESMISLRSRSRTRRSDQHWNWTNCSST